MFAQKLSKMNESTPKTNSPPVDKDAQYSPVTLPQSPAAGSPQKNLTGIPRLVSDIAADIYNHIQHWNDYHIRGASLLKQIGSLKYDNPMMYPPGLEDLTNSLAEIVQNLFKISKGLLSLSSKMCSVTKLNTVETPVFISLSASKLGILVQDIALAYADEINVKKQVLENIAHTTNKDELMFYSVCWIHQQHVTNAVILQLETLLLETGHRKIT